jgi:CBS domain-containing protein
LWCRAEEAIRDVAVRVGEAGQSCVLLRTGIHHLAVVGPAGEPIGVVRAVDLAHFEVRAPLSLRSTIHAAANLEALAEAGRAIPSTVAELRANGVPAVHCGGVHAALVDAVLCRALAVRPRAALAEVRSSWLVLGSLARREPLPYSDLDTALLWTDPLPPAPDPGPALRAAAGEVLADLRQCGLVPCPNGANADNPLFSRSQSAWAAAAHQWMDDPTVDGALLLCAMISDSRPVTELALGREVTRLLMSRTRTSQFLRALLDEALRWRPSTGVLRDFLVARNGAHRGQFDLKRGGLVPVVALGRWIGIVTGDARGTTRDRLARGADAGLITPDERDTLLGGFDHVYTVAFDLEVRALRSGAAPSTYLRPRDLDSLTRRLLRETLRAVHAVHNRVDESWIGRIGQLG